MLLVLKAIAVKNKNNMRIIESFTEGKAGDESRNEDRIVVTDDFVAVLDGVTSKSDAMIKGKTGGRFAVELAEGEIRRFPAEITAREAVDSLTLALRTEISKLSEETERPGFAMALYARHRQQVWRVADPVVVIDGKPFPHRLVLDEINSNARALAIEIALKRGATVEDLMRHDTARDAILPFLKSGQLFANAPGPYGYGVINGMDVPDAFIHVMDAGGAKEVILASDGYPEVFATLEETEARLFDILKQDPLLFRTFKSAKGLKTGNVSFDDRAYVRFAP